MGDTRTEDDDDRDRIIQQLREQVAKLQAFKDWVHSYLDAHSVPYHPPGTHGAEGCRIGDRMDWLMAQQAALRERLAKLVAIAAEWERECLEAREECDQQHGEMEKENVALRERLAKVVKSLREYDPNDPQGFLYISAAVLKEVAS